MELKKGRNKITIKEYQEIRYIFDIGEENVNHKETLNILDKMLNGEKNRGKTSGFQVSRQILCLPWKQNIYSHKRPFGLWLKAHTNF